MDIKFQAFSFAKSQRVNSGVNNNFQNYSNMNFSLKNDVFVRSPKAEPSFAGKKVENNLSEDLLAIGIVGAPFVLSIAGGTYMMKKCDSKDIFLPDGTYLMSTDNLSLKTDKINADGLNGSIKIEGTGIDIDPDKYDYDVCIPEKGIYKNYDGSVDIDLLNHKYIDVANKVFIDPANKISAVFDGNSMQNIVIPSFSGTSMSGNEHYIATPTRSEYINAHNGQVPENDPIYDMYKDKTDLNLRVAYPDDNRTNMQKLADFFNPFARNRVVNFDKTKEYDIFGREILTVKDADGSITKFGLDERLAKIAEQNNISNENLGEICKFVDNIRLKDYIVSNHPACENLEIAEYETMDSFIKRITGADSVDVDVIDSNDIDEQIAQTEDIEASSLLDILFDLV